MMSIDLIIFRSSCATNSIGCELLSVDFELRLLVYKAVHRLALDYIAEMCLPVGTVETRQRLRSSTAGDLLVPHTNTQFGQRAFSVAAVKSLNNLYLVTCGHLHPSLLSKRLSKLIHLLDHRLRQSCYLQILFILFYLFIYCSSCSYVI